MSKTGPIELTVINSLITKTGFSSNDLGSSVEIPAFEIKTSIPLVNLET